MANHNYENFEVGDSVVMNRKIQDIPKYLLDWWNRTAVETPLLVYAVNEGMNYIYCVSADGVKVEGPGSRFILNKKSSDTVKKFMRAVTSTQYGLIGDKK